MVPHRRCPWFLVLHESRAGHETATGGLIAEHVDALQLEIRVTVVRAREVDAVRLVTGAAALLLLLLLLLLL